MHWLRMQKKCLRCYDKNLWIECACGCGNILGKHDSNSRVRRFILGHYTRVMENNPLKLGFKGDKHYFWKGGRKIDNGYMMIRVGVRDYIPEHRLMMEKHLGRKLLHEEQVHHINHNKLDNRLKNLQLTTLSEHPNLHQRLRDELGQFM